MPFAVEEQEGTQRLILRRGSYVPGVRQIRKKRLDLLRAELPQMTLAMEEDETPDPVAVRLLGASAVVLGPDQRPSLSGSYGLPAAGPPSTLPSMRRKLAGPPEGSEEMGRELTAESSRPTALRALPVFHVYLNGRKVSTAGVGDTGVLGAHVSWVRRRGEHALSKKSNGVEEELRLHVGGLITPAREHVCWLDRDLKIGDEVRISVAEDTKVDRPRSRERLDSAKELRSQKRYVREMAKKFGWKIQTQR